MCQRVYDVVEMIPYDIEVSKCVVGSRSFKYETEIPYDNETRNMAQYAMTQAMSDTEPKPNNIHIYFGLKYNSSLDYIKAFNVYNMLTDYLWKIYDIRTIFAHFCSLEEFNCIMKKNNVDISAMYSGFRRIIADDFFYIPNDVSRMKEMLECMCGEPYKIQTEESMRRFCHLMYNYLKKKIK